MLGPIELSAAERYTTRHFRLKILSRRIAILRATSMSGRSWSRLEIRIIDKTEFLSAERLLSIGSKSLAGAGRLHGSRDRVALPISGDNPKAKATVAQLIDRIGFDSVDAGTIAESWRQQPGSPVYCINPTKEELQQLLKN